MNVGVVQKRNLSCHFSQLHCTNIYRKHQFLWAQRASDASRKWQIWSYKVLCLYLSLLLFSITKVICLETDCFVPLKVRILPQIEAITLLLDKTLDCSRNDCNVTNRGSWFSVKIIKAAWKGLLRKRQLVLMQIFSGSMAARWEILKACNLESTSSLLMKVCLLCCWMVSRFSKTRRLVVYFYKAYMLLTLCSRRWSIYQLLCICFLLVSISEKASVEISMAE